VGLQLNLTKLNPVAALPFCMRRFIDGGEIVPLNYRTGAERPNSSLFTYRARPTIQQVDQLVGLQLDCNGAESGRSAPVLYCMAHREWLVYEVPPITICAKAQS
jgi:hypothetical protein